MSDAQSRPAPARGRGSSRGGRGGHSTRGRGGRPSVSKQDTAEPSSVEEDDDELREIKSRYKSEFATVKEIYPDWADADIVFALQETDGDLESTIEGIASGIYPGNQASFYGTDASHQARSAIFLKSKRRPRNDRSPSNQVPVPAPQQRTHLPPLQSLTEVEELWKVHGDGAAVQSELGVPQEVDELGGRLLSPN